MIARVALLVSSSLLVGCSKDPPPQGAAAPSATSPEAAAAPDRAAPPCEDGAAVRAHMGKECAVVGRYEIKNYSLKRGSSLREWPVVVLADGTEVMIESIWDGSKKPAPEVAESLRGKRVRVRGKLHASPPRESPENIAFPCVSPVQEITVAPP